MVRGQLGFYAANRQLLSRSWAKCQSKPLILRSMASSSDSDSYQYLQRSKLPTMYFQKSLPRLPIPLVEKTCERFLAAVQPITTGEEFAETQQVVGEFKSNEAVELNAMLKMKDEANKHTSYISEPWFDMYLKDRAPLPLNYNPLLAMKNDTRPEYQHQLVKAANIIITSLRFWRSLQAELLEPEVFHMNPKKSDTESYRRWMRLTPKIVATYASYAFKAFPLDMVQYERLFGTSRIPGMEKDHLVQSPNSKHIMIMRRGNIYAVDVLNENGLIEKPQEILARLNAVVNLDNSKPAAEVPIGVLTASQRNEWARVREYMTKSAVNDELLSEQIDKALFCICLDTEEDPTFSEANPIPAFKNMLAGKATNRWFDKSLSMLLTADGTAAINFEHSWGDGVAVLRYFNEVYKETMNKPYLSTADLKSVSQISVDSSKVRYLNFEIDDKLKEEVRKAYDQNQKNVNSLNMQMLIYPKLSKQACKTDRLSPDSIMQLSFQLAYKQAFGKYVGTYESCSTAAFRHGRTETMRPCTMATKEFCDNVLASQQNFDAKKLRSLIDKCSTYHSQLTKDAAMGQGFDRHLFALKHTAVINNKPIPKFYELDAYKRINYNIISTSTLSSDGLLSGSFGPVVRDGLGIGYSIQNEMCGVVVTSYENGCNGQEFISSLEQSFNTIRRVIDESK
ncbi:carnitine O-palmitoyltransferase 2, mitochondrial [Musca domestica]|uniref:Carnitine O-palmitoyltransferase 2, mitochondrial n=2 Tax=Musca domestica TaxID=7370 RepID=A0A1I8N626_MUSDO|nr:carnitine O-palmitoyltransferase 2, mitochondrial [Musca domestica]XP_005181444.1 carnitine O-palmitoyltransferase 2, mitochondrial [Musca domestica]XP_058985924.1 carnitine O-palmitoyltransferase 2, mitochondrial [Musca domestica]